MAMIPVEVSIEGLRAMGVVGRSVEEMVERGPRRLRVDSVRRKLMPVLWEMKSVKDAIV